MVDYRKRLTEVEIILNHLSRKDFNKIPKELIKTISENKDDNYVWYFDETQALKDQDVHKDTIAILSYINIKYLLNEKQRKFIQKVHNENELIHQGELRSKYSPDDLFKNKRNKEKTEDLAIVEYKENFFMKILNKIRNFFQIGR